MVCKVFLIFVTLIALILAFVQGRTRTITDEYNESKFVVVAIFCWLQVLVVGLPLVYVSHTGKARLRNV